MLAKEYEKEFYGRVVAFEDVRRDYKDYAKVFASGSTALEKTLLTMWKKGIETIACGNGYDERVDNFSLACEQNIQSRYQLYTEATGLQKLQMVLHKRDYIPMYHGYIALDMRTIPNVKKFKKKITKNLKKEKCFFFIEEGITGGKEVLLISLSVYRNTPSTYQRICLDAITKEEALQLTLPKPDIFDRCFDAITKAVEK